MSDTITNVCSRLHIRHISSLSLYNLIIYVSSVISNCIQVGVFKMTKTQDSVTYSTWLFCKCRLIKCKQSNKANSCNCNSKIQIMTWFLVFLLTNFNFLINFKYSMCAEETCDLINCCFTKYTRLLRTFLKKCDLKHLLYSPLQQTLKIFISQ